MILFRKRRLARLRAARDAAQEAYSAAKARRDTRAMAKALRRLTDATHALMRAEAKR